MKKIVCITYILLVILIPCQSQQQKLLYEFSFVDAKFDTLLLDCNKRSPKSIKQFTVHIGYKSDYTSVVINGVNKNKSIEDYGYCGYTEVNTSIYFIYGDCRDGIVDHKKICWIL